MASQEGSYRRPLPETPLEVGALEIERVTRANIENFLRAPTTFPKILFKIDRNDNGQLMDHNSNNLTTKLVAPKDVLSATVIKVLEEVLSMDQKRSKVVKRTIHNEDDHHSFGLPIGTVLEYRTYPIKDGNIVKRFSVVSGDGIISDEWALQKEHKFILLTGSLTPRKTLSAPSRGKTV